ncbi:hypothetical protein FTM_0764 [Francisella tularensis subsp. mediasiatica FSC147]|nr:hypothetical protein FTM_0764 [Francisella tularensis subsp. mediasiatica FSC147]AKE20868.1 hypothetical protein RO31_0858 [Francisella tularensis subsp. tularensis str. SCHU S4 substr. NR-28534]
MISANSLIWHQIVNFLNENISKIVQIHSKAISITNIDL